MKQLPERELRIQFPLPLLQPEIAALPPEEQRELIQVLAQKMMPFWSLRIIRVAPGTAIMPCCDSL